MNNEDDLNEIMKLHYFEEAIKIKTTLGEEAIKIRTTFEVSHG